MLTVPEFQRDSAHWWQEGTEGSRSRKSADHTSVHTQKADRKQDVGRGYKRPKPVLGTSFRKSVAPKGSITSTSSAPNRTFRHKPLVTPLRPPQATLYCTRFLGEINELVRLKFKFSRGSYLIYPMANCPS